MKYYYCDSIYDCDLEIMQCWLALAPEDSFDASSHASHAIRIELSRGNIQRHLSRSYATGVVAIGLGYECLLRRRKGIRTLALGPAIDKAASSVRPFGHPRLCHNLTTQAVLELLLYREVELGTLPSTGGRDLGGKVEILGSADCCVKEKGVININARRLEKVKQGKTNRIIC